MNGKNLHRKNTPFRNVAKIILVHLNKPRTKHRSRRNGIIARKLARPIDQRRNGQAIREAILPGKRRNELRQVPGMRHPRYPYRDRLILAREVDDGVRLVVDMPSDFELERHVLGLRFRDDV